MSTFSGSKADILTPQFGAVVQTTADFDVTDATTVLPGLEVTLSEPGRYLVSLQLLGQLELSAGAPAQIGASLALQPLAGAPLIFLPATSIMVVAATQTGVLFETTSTLVSVVDIAEPSLLCTRIVRTAPGSPIYTLARIQGTNPFGDSLLTATQILN